MFFPVWYRAPCSSLLNFIAYDIPLSQFLLFYQSLRGGFVEQPSLTKAGQQYVAKFVAMIIINLVTPKAAVKHEQQTGLWPSCRASSQIEAR